MDEISLDKNFLCWIEVLFKNFNQQNLKWKKERKKKEKSRLVNITFFFLLEIGI